MEKQIQTQRDNAVDILRLFCCFGVIIIHVHSSTKAADGLGSFFSLFCVQFFFATSLFYFIKSLNDNLDVTNIIKKIWLRIGLPFISWSVIYLSFITIKHIILSNYQPINIVRVILYGESSEHLYYLSELIVLQLLALSIYLLVKTNNKLKGLFILLLAVLYLSWGSYFKYYGILPPQSIITYLVVSFYIESKKYILAFSNTNLMLGILLVIISISGYIFSYPFFLQVYLLSLPILGIGLLMIVLNIPKFNIPRWLSYLFFTTYGIYLSHVLFLEGIEFVLAIISYKIYYTFFTKLAVGSIVFIISVIFVSFIRNSVVLKQLFLGEGR